ncbi:glycosyl transferase group 1 [Gloeothece citriformis PCC 7424]|uniref:Glycosyl transferase group 1 n=1 Tax=Gloeothece citriformis (strain PCC 7424) TaxID=65393 RepID=B7KCV6_GLOC7|nr:glycosyltransferase family 1 protein [Gloeothece citriformis]ACK71657.1 glycosyl transferase group 1 [Gloeothece citriformis PCC 7424]
MSFNKRIAFISVHGDPAIDIGKEEAGGQNVYVRQVGEALAKQGWQVDMFTRKADATQPAIVEHSPNCRTIRLVAGPETFIPRDKLFSYLPEFVEQLRSFQRDNNIQYSLVHTNYWLSAWVGMELKKYQPIQQIHTYHSLGAVKYQSVSDIPPIATTRLEVEKACLETAARIVATSPQEQDHMRQLMSQKGNIDIIPCGTDIERFGAVSSSEARLKLGIPRSSLVVLYVGRFDQRKGIETLVRAMGHSIFPGLADIRLIIVGGSRPGQSDGIERERIEAIVDELGLRDYTTFPGQIDHETLPYYYAAANLCVVPSHYEPFGLVAIEAMAAGTPVVASGVGGLQFTVVHEKTGLLCPPKDDKAFAQAIDSILSKPTWQAKLGKSARKRVETLFSWDGVAQQLSNLYLSLVDVPTAKPTVNISLKQVSA